VPHGWIDPDLIPTPVVPTPAVVPGGANEHASAEYQCPRYDIREDDRGIVNRHVNPFGVSRRDVDNSRSAFVARRHHLFRGRFEIANALGLGAEQLYRMGYVVGLERKRHPK